MDSSPALDAARHFLTIVWDGERPSDEVLLAALDRVVAAYHVTPDGQVTDSNVDAPREGGAALYEQVLGRFPDYGTYALADPSKPLEDAMMMGDAIDDLADLTLDMREVIWLAENLGVDDAHWAFRLHFFHWGQHARELSLYLCSRLFG